MTEWRSRARALTDQLAALGVLDPAWRDPFERVPRHVFVPRFYRPDGSIVDGTDSESVNEWLNGVYRDESLTTEQLADPGVTRFVPTSSSTRPSLMALMLKMLDVRDGDSVLEIGTGTGYNAALLSYRLGGDQVTSIDIGPALVEFASERTRSIDLLPYLVAGDGAEGVPERAPYDRIIATCAVPKIPGQWITQLADGGIIVADLRAATSSCLITLRRESNGNVEGRFQEVPGYFMWLRPYVDDPRRDEQESNFSYNHTGSRRSTTSIDPALVDDPGLGLMVAGCVPNLIQSVTLTDPPLRGLRASDGSWARVNLESREVIQAGHRSVWSEIEPVARRWDELGRPTPSQFGLTVSPDLVQRFWLDHEVHGRIDLG